MLIGIDASRTTAARRTGTENYALSLTRELLALGHDPPGRRFRLYFNDPPPPGLFKGRAERRIIPFPRLWTHLRLSWEMATRPPDLLFVPAHVLPLIHPRKSVVTVHDLGYLYYPEAHTRFQNAYLRWSTRYNTRTAARVLADSQATCDDLVRHCQISADKIAVVYPGRDESLAPVTDPAALSAVRGRYGLTGRYLLHVGTLQPRKNLIRLLHAFASLQGGHAGPPLQDVDDLQLVITGKKGWLYGDLLAEVQKLGLAAEGRVVLTGYVPDADLPALLSGALAFCFPSLYEGFGLPVIEAMSCGAPVVCSHASSLPEVAGDAALLVDPLDVGALAAALGRIAADEGLRGDLRERGFRQASRFSWRQCAKEVLAVLEEVGRELD
ncbi:MAG: glycosyltransferase family 4 protein [Anaerolineae bacterium]|nr:glycosyltransferase family 4 protein [Anaerolineae bacterium]